jgi:hypothetical protein
MVVLAPPTEEKEPVGGGLELFCLRYQCLFFRREREKEKKEN